MKPTRLIKICLNETCGRVWVGKYLSDKFAMKNGLKQMFKLALEYVTIRGFRQNPEGLKFNGTHQLLIYADNVNILGGRIHTTREKTAAGLVIANKNNNLEVNAEKTKNMVMSQDQNARQKGNIQIGNKSFKKVEHFKYLETTLTNKNYIHEEIKRRFKPGRACYRLVQKLLYSSLLPNST
jgi:hypothetical protein